MRRMNIFLFLAAPGFVWLKASAWLCGMETELNLRDVGDGE